MNIESTFYMMRTLVGATKGTSGELTLQKESGTVTL